MDWLSMTVRTTTEGAEAVSAMFISMGIQGAVIEDKADIDLNQRPVGFWDILDPSLADKYEDDVKVTVYIPADNRAADTVALAKDRLAAMKSMDMGFDCGKLSLDVGSVDDEDWAENWKQSYKTFRLGEHFVIKPTWEKYEAQPEDKVIIMDPGMAFGSGTHETTGMCVALIEQLVKPGMTVIDVGTGTGILAMAAAMMGAGDVLATDLDPMATRVAGENIEANGLSHVIRTATGDLLEAVDEVADVVVANIIADVICFMAAPVQAHIKKGGKFICSGIARERKDEVLAALNKAGYLDIDVHEMGEWAAIASTRP